MLCNQMKCQVIIVFMLVFVLTNLLGLITIGSAGNVYPLRDAENYLEIPTREYVKQTPYYARLNHSLMKFNIPQDLKPKDIQELLLGAGKRDDFVQENFRILLLELADGNVKCDTIQISALAIFDLIALIREDRDNDKQNLRWLDDYLKYFGGPTFAKCAAKINRFRHDPFMSEKGLDLLFSALTSKDLEYGKSSESLFEQVRSIDLTSDVLVVSHLKHIFSKQRIYSKKPNKVAFFLVDYLQERCIDFKNTFAPKLNILNLAYFFDASKVSFPTNRIKKLNEYRYICLGFESEDTQNLIVSNFERLLAEEFKPKEVDRNRVVEILPVEKSAEHLNELHPHIKKKRNWFKRFFSS